MNEEKNIINISLKKNHSINIINKCLSYQFIEKIYIDLIETLYNIAIKIIFEFI